MNNLPWFPLYGEDWARSTANLTPEAKGVYIDLLVHAWAEGGIPMDAEACRRIARADREEWARVWPALEGKWVAQDGRLVNPRQARERAEADALAEAKRRGGKKSVESRRRKFGSAQPGAKASVEQSSEQSSEQSVEDSPIHPQLHLQNRSTPPPQIGGGVDARAREVPPPSVVRMACLELVEAWRLAVPATAVNPAKLTGDDFKRLRAALQTRSLDEWTAVFARVTRSDYLTGRDGQHPPISLWRALEWASRVEAGEFDDHRAGAFPVRQAGLRGGGVSVTRPRAVVHVIDPESKHRFPCAHAEPCTTWAQHRDRLLADEAAS